MPTRKALRHSRRRNTDLRVFYFFITYTITSSLGFQISLLTEFTGRLLKLCRRDERRLSLRHGFSRHAEGTTPVIQSMRKYVSELLISHFLRDRYAAL